MSGAKDGVVTTNVNITYLTYNRIVLQTSQNTLDLAMVTRQGSYSL